MAMMKIKPEHYAQLSAALEAIRPKIGQATAQYREVGLSEKQLRWDAFRAAKVAGDSTRWLCDVLYQYMDDTHMDTALRKWFNHVA